MTQGKRIVLESAIAISLVLGGVAIWYFWIREPPEPMRLILRGRVEVREVKLSLSSKERVAAVHVQEGDTVTEGQLLVELETDQLSSQLTGAEAKAQAQRETIAGLEAGARPEEIERARAQRDVARAELEKAQTALETLRQKANAGEATTDEVVQAQTEFEAARGRLTAAEGTLELTLAGPRQDEIDGARATLRSLEADVDLLRKQLADARLLAPVAGVVRDRNVEPGDTPPAEEPTIILSITQPVWVRTWIGDEHIGSIWPGMRAVVTSVSAPGREFEGRIGHIAPAAAEVEDDEQIAPPQERAYQVRVLVDKPDNQLRLGALAVVTIDLTQNRADAKPPKGEPDQPASAAP